MALASAKSSALEDNNKAVATGMKWSVEARAEISQAMRDEMAAFVEMTADRRAVFAKRARAVTLAAAKRARGGGRQGKCG